MNGLGIFFPANQILCYLPCPSAGQEENGWGKSIVQILSKELQKEFYIQMAKRYGWTKRVLTNFIEAQTYEKYLLNQTNFELTVPENRKVQAMLAWP